MAPIGKLQSRYLSLALCYEHCQIPNDTLRFSKMYDPSLAFCCSPYHYHILLALLLFCSPGSYHIIKLDTSLANPLYKLRNLYHNLEY